MTAIDQHTVELLAGASSFSALSEEDAAKVAAVVESRLLLALCMDAAPTEKPDLSLWEQLLATAIVVFSNLDAQGIQSEHVRNYSYTMSANSGTWAKLSELAGDLLAHFSKCPCGITMQTDITPIIYGEHADKFHDLPVGGAL